MPLAPLPPRAFRFFSAFHRYSTLLTIAPHTPPHRSLHPSSTRPFKSQRHNLSTTPHHRTPIASTAPSEPPPPQQEPPPSPNQPPPTQPPTHYTLFPQTLPLGPPPNSPFPIPLRALHAEYLTLQATAHPDRHPSGSAKTRAEALSSHINDAYRTLADPLRRAEYLLGLQGIDLRDETSTLGGRVDLDGDDDGEGGVGMGLLGEVMAIREEIEEAETEEAVEGLKRENEERIAGTVERMGGGFEREDVRGARREAVRLRYWYNIREALGGWERGRGGGGVVH